MFKACRQIILSIILLCIAVIYLSADQIPVFTIMTEEWKPYQYEEDGYLKGITVDLLVLILKEIGSEQGRDDIQLVPWSRGYYTLQNRENTILFSTTRTPERESQFKWVGPIVQNTYYLIGKKSREIKIDNHEQILNYSIGTIYEDVGEMYLNRLGYPKEKMQRTNVSENNIGMLDLNRIDLVISGWNSFAVHAEIVGVNPDLYEPVYIIDSDDISFAFHISTPDSVILRFQEAFEKIKERGELDDLFTFYGELRKD